MPTTRTAAGVRRSDGPSSPLANDRTTGGASMSQPLRSHATESIRNIAILGHAGSGKTTLIEALLAKAGEIRSAGSVEKGSTVCDFTDQEKRLRHSLDVHVCHLHHAGREVNLLDTPGYPDFIGPRARGAAGRRNGGGRRERRVGHRDRDAADDDVRCRAQALPADHREQDRRGADESRARARRDPRALRPRMSAAQPARASRPSGRRLLLRPDRGDPRFLVGRDRASRDHRPRRRARRCAHGSLPRAR